MNTIIQDQPKFIQTLVPFYVKVNYLHKDLIYDIKALIWTNVEVNYRYQVI